MSLREFAVLAVLLAASLRVIPRFSLSLDGPAVVEIAAIPVLGSVLGEGPSYCAFVDDAAWERMFTFTSSRQA